MATTLSCGHQADHNCSGVEVTWDGEECVAGEGFVPTTYYGIFCHLCAEALAYEKGKDAGRAEIEDLREKLDYWIARAERQHKALQELADFDEPMSGPIARAALEVEK